MTAVAGRDPRVARRLLGAVTPVGVGVVAFVLARSILLPGQGFWDTGEFQVVPPVLGTAHPTGYPTYVILGWLASLVLGPLGEPALRMNLLSAILLGVAAGLTVVLVRQLTGRNAIAAAAGLLLALTPIPWRAGAFADPHTLHLALTAGLLVILVGWDQRRRAGAAKADRWLVGAAALYGVMLGNHTLTILLAPGIALFVLAVEPGILRRLRFVLLCAGVLVGTVVTLYLELPVRAAMGAPIVYGTPNTWAGFWYVVLAQQFGGDLVNPFGDLARKAADLAGLASAQLGVLAVAVPAAFLVLVFRRPRYALLTGVGVVITCWFAASYTNAAIDRYYLVPALLAITWLAVAAGVLVDALESRSETVDGAMVDPFSADPAADTARAGPTLPGGARAAVVALVGVALAVGLVAPAAMAAPAARTGIDLSHDTRAADWSGWVLDTVGRDSVIVSWWSYSTPLWYRTVARGERPDVWVIDDRDRLDENLGSIDDVIRANLPSRPVFLVRPYREIVDLGLRWELEMVADPLGQQPLYRVVGPRPAGTAPNP